MSGQYVKSAVTNVEEDLSRSGKIFPSKCATPLSINHAPWLEDSPELTAGGVKKYQECISQIRWSVEIGRINIMLVTLLLSSYLTMNRVGHLE